MSVLTANLLLDDMYSDLVDHHMCSFGCTLLCLTKRVIIHAGWGHLIGSERAHTQIYMYHSSEKKGMKFSTLPTLCYTTTLDKDIWKCGVWKGIIFEGTEKTWSPVSLQALVCYSLYLCYNTDQCWWVDFSLFHFFKNCHYFMWNATSLSSLD